MPSQDTASVKAQYTSPNGTHTFSLPLQSKASISSTTEERTTYLAELRASTKQLQADVNKFLTQKMEEDKARSSDKISKQQEELEEQNYGEEAPEED
jgi:type IV secretory pathway VirB9-like protein